MQHETVERTVIDRTLLITFLTAAADHFRKNAHHLRKLDKDLDIVTVAQAAAYACQCERHASEADNLIAAIKGADRVEAVKGGAN